MQPIQLFAYRVSCGQYVSQEWTMGTWSMIEDRLKSLNAIEGGLGWTAEEIQLSPTESDLRMIIAAFWRSKILLNNSIIVLMISLPGP